MGRRGLDLGDAQLQLGGVHTALLPCMGEPGHAPTLGPRQPPLSPTAGLCPLKQLAMPSVRKAGDHQDQFGGAGVAACPTRLLAQQEEGCAAPPAVTSTCQHGGTGMPTWCPLCHGSGVHYPEPGHEHTCANVTLLALHLSSTLCLGGCGFLSSMGAQGPIATSLWVLPHPQGQGELRGLFQPLCWGRETRGNLFPLVLAAPGSWSQGGWSRAHYPHLPP